MWDYLLVMERRRKDDETIAVIAIKKITEYGNGKKLGILKSIFSLCGRN